MPKPPPTGPLVTRDTIAAQLRELGVRTGETLLVHSSLSALGWVCGGAVAVVQGLLDALAPDGTLVVPTQTGDLSDPALWSNPPVPEDWWDTIRPPCPPTTPSSRPRAGSACPGDRAHLARRPAQRAPADLLRGDRPRARRCSTATPPTAASASAARWPGWRRCTHACCCSAPATPPARASISPSTAIPSPLVAVGRPGPAGWEVVTEVSISSDRFDELGHDFERDRPVVRGKVGAADVRLFPVADAVGYAGAVAGAAPPARGGRSGAPGGAARVEILHPAVCGAPANLDSGPCEVSPWSRSTPW